MAILNGADIVDTSIWNFAGGPAAPSFELIQIFCNKMDIETGVNIEAIVKIGKELKEIRKELASFDSYKDHIPIDFDITKDKLSPEISKLFDDAIEYAKADKQNELLDACNKIENHFNFPAPDENVKFAEIPGGMYTNMLAQLKQLKLESLLTRTLEIIPSVRLAAGCPPLVTPTSQIVGVQAVNCIIDENKGLPYYTTKSIQFVNLVKGSYGKTPVPIEPEFRFKIAGVKEETPYNPSYHRKPENPTFEEYGGVKLAQNEKEELLLELFPSVANKYLKDKIEERYLAEIYKVEEEKQRKIDEEKAKYANLTPEEKEQRLIHGLYNYNWTSFGKYE